MNYIQAKEYISSISRLGIVPGLDTIRELLKELRNPQEKLRFVHIAGTNGKGSIAAYLSYILAASGYRVGRYLSPAVFNERETIQILEAIPKEEKGNVFEKSFCSFMIEKNAIANHITIIRHAIDKMIEKGGQAACPTVFEIETAMAFLEFLEKGCDIVVLEAGMGGKMDATNIVKNVECSIIASISRDHTAFLGNTLEKIAEEKAGIIKEYVPVIASPQKPEVEAVLRKKAEEKNTEIRFSELCQAKQVFHIFHGMVCSDFLHFEQEFEKKFEQKFGKKKVLIEEEQKKNGIYFLYTGYTSKKQIEVYLPMLGSGQLENALTALNAAELLKNKSGYYITENAVKEGLSHMVWPGRFEIVKKQPLVIIDGAHNEAAAEHLAESIRMYLLGKETEKKGRLCYILGIFQDKEVEKIIEKTAAMADIILTVTPDSPRGLSSCELKKRIEYFWKKMEKKGYIEDCKNVELGWKRALELMGKEDTILIFGSLSFLHSIVHEMEVSPAR